MQKTITCIKSIKSILTRSQKVTRLIFGHNLAGFSRQIITLYRGLFLRPRVFATSSIWISLILILIVPGILNADTKIKKISVYALTVETTIKNGKNTESRFTMIPADEEFRIEGFKMEISTGSPSESSKNPFEDSVYDALSRLTVNKGLKSVSSSQIVLDGNLTDVTVMKHEGVIRYPYKTRILKTGRNNGTNVEVEVEFSAFSMPSEWGWQRFKKSVSNYLYDVVSVFRQIWD